MKRLPQELIPIEKYDSFIDTFFSEIFASQPTHTHTHTHTYTRTLAMSGRTTTSPRHKEILAAKKVLKEFSGQANSPSKNYCNITVNNVGGK